MHPHAIASLAKPTVAGVTIKQAAEALACRAVRVRAGAPTTEKKADIGQTLHGWGDHLGSYLNNKASEIGGKSILNSAKGWWNDPTNTTATNALSRGAVGAGIGGLAGLGLSATSKDEDSHPLNSALTGALAGGALGAGGSLVYDNMNQMQNRNQGQSLRQQLKENTTNEPSAVRQFLGTVNPKHMKPDETSASNFTAPLAAINAPFIPADIRRGINSSVGSFHQFNRGLDNYLPKVAPGASPGTLGTSISGSDDTVRRLAFDSIKKNRPVADPSSFGFRAGNLPGLDKDSWKSWLNPSPTARTDASNLIRDLNAAGISHNNYRRIAESATEEAPNILRRTAHLGGRLGLPALAGGYLSGWFDGDGSGAGGNPYAR